MSKGYVSFEEYERLKIRVEELEVKLETVLEKLGFDDNQSETVKRNETAEYVIKLVYPGIYLEIDKPIAAFPKNRLKIAKKIEPGSFMFIYVTSPEKKIIGLTRVLDSVKEMENSRWPYYLPLEWVIGPKSMGVTFKDVDLNIRPRVGDTIFSIPTSKAMEIIDTLKNQQDLDSSTTKLLISRYAYLLEKE
jgi:hypothetical protein